ncbi:TPA: hypothetical protein HA361_02225 [Candidatus Woesearchaeota archaeon]|nr:hypothetical protein [Candidatus Woesearchaeota archaeon]HII68316.1 hypothetical protein [Candidatus Woesearchaeota archaeon]
MRTPSASGISSKSLNRQWHEQSERQKKLGRKFWLIFFGVKLIILILMVVFLVRFAQIFLHQ